MRRYARLDPPAVGREGGEEAAPSRRPRTEMTLEILWFCLLAFLWTGYFVLEGFDFGVGMLLPGPRQQRGRPQDDVRVDRPALGRERGLARRSRAARPSRPSRSGTRRCSRASTSRCSSILAFLIVRVLLVRMAREGGEPAVEGVLGLAEHDRRRSGRRSSGASRSRASCTASRSPRTQTFAGDFGDLFSGYSVAGRDRGRPPLRAPRRGFPHACGRSGISGSARSARRVASRRQPRSSAPASSSGRSSSRTTQRQGPLPRHRSPSRSRRSPPSPRSCSCAAGDERWAFVADGDRDRRRRRRRSSSASTRA